MTRGRQGTLRVQPMPGESFSAFLPAPLPPDPPLVLDGELTDLLESANRALGRLDGLSLLIPDIALFLYFYVRKEAVLSSQIEGTQSSLSDLLLFESSETPGVPLDDVREVSQYVAALDFGIARIRDGFPISSRLMRDIHGVLLSSGRGSEKQPGEFRRSQNWIGGTRPGNALFVPPPAADVPDCIGALENFLHDIPARTPTLLKAALTHVQFETIHPFLDGNGRVGRLLIPLLLCAENALREPLLYLSYFFRQHRARYYELLTLVRETGDWEAWTRFFLEGVRETADMAAQSARDIVRLFDADQKRLGAQRRGAASLLRVHHLLRRRPLLSIGAASRELGLSQPTTTAALRQMETLGIVRETSGRRRSKLFIYDGYFNLLNEGTGNRDL